jgi:Sec-independent protein secretion pathway component TatC
MRRIKPIAHEEQLPVVDHLDELRSRLIVVGAAFLVAFGLTTWQSDLVLGILNAPLPDGLEPITLGPSEPFIATLKSAGYAAVLLVLPILLYEAYAFVVPAFRPHERRVVAPLVAMVPIRSSAGSPSATSSCSHRHSTSCSASTPPSSTPSFARATTTTS